MKIMKASAGSGKTFNLSKTYIEYLLGADDPHAYRHILAVTFTNKATAEMKSRILRDLYTLSSTDSRARDMLINILHDYSAFSVSTIDKFFQQTLKAFSREIGQFADYQIEIDTKSLIQEAMDRILDSLTEEDTELLNWIKSCVSESLEHGDKISIENDLYATGYLLRSEAHRELEAKYGADEWGKERLDSVRKECKRIIDDFLEKAARLGVETSRTQLVKKPGVRALAASTKFQDLFDRPFKQYCTAFIVEGLLFSLGLAGEFYKSFDQLLKEKNVMCLDDSNTILKNIINGSDAPFVYEKMGVRYKDFLLDEFQDTSVIQWDNFLPLLKESESSGGSGLVVGDVKQSIYRFRNSDWRLLGECVSQEFPGADVQTLTGNWRSTRRVVEFNNSLFSYMASGLSLSDLYSDVSQTPMSKDPQEGFVKVTFTDDQLDEVVLSIRRALDAGARLSDIAVLVRTNAIGTDLAMYIIQQGYPVISDDSLRLKSSVIVRRLVSLLSGFENPDDSVKMYLASSMDIEFPSAYHSLVDLCEALLRDIQSYDPRTFEGETLFIQAFMDNLQTWSDINGNDLRSFLKNWDNSDPYISSPEDSDAVRILTIHKSKGLEYPYLIFPFAEKVTFFKNTVKWCHLDTSQTGLPDDLSGLYAVGLQSTVEDSYFSEQLNEERRLQLVDNINLFYVAFTRASKVLHIISDEPTKSLRDSVAKNKPRFSKFSDMLYAFVGACYDREYGSMYDFSRMDRNDKAGFADFPASYRSIALGDRLAPSADAADFFADDGSAGTTASARLRGIVLHDILSRVVTPGNLEDSVAISSEEGSFTPKEAASALELLRKRIESHPEWFPAEVDGIATRVENEKPIFDAHGFENRPDRVLIKEDGVVIIDFKFGLHDDEKYLRQLRRYASLYRQLGYNVLAGVIWYVVNDECKYI